jgi:hypothetical protein
MAWYLVKHRDFTFSYKFLTGGEGDAGKKETT